MHVYEEAITAMNSFVWSMDADLFSLKDMQALLELLPQLFESWVIFNFGVDVSKCMAQVFVGTTLGLLYKL